MVTGRGPAQGHQWRGRSPLQSRSSRAMPIQSRLSQCAAVRSSAHRHNYNVQGFHSASLRCSFWPNWAFNATAVCRRQNRASTCGALTSVLCPNEMPTLQCPNRRLPTLGSFLFAALRLHRMRETVAGFKARKPTSTCGDSFCSSVCGLLKMAVARQPLRSFRTAVGQCCCMC